MWGMPIELVKEALQLFMQGLPNGSFFKIISFGSHFQSLDIEGGKQGLIPYNDETKKEALDKIGDFDANFGGTEIYKPTKDAFDTKIDDNMERRIFFLTDGYASDGPHTIELIKERCSKDKNTKCYSFGISDSCDTNLVQKFAELGNGSCSLIRNNEMSIIKEAVMISLRRAGVPAMQGCSFDFGNGQQKGFRDGNIYLGHLRKLGTLYQNEIVRVFAMMTEEEFEKMNCVFKCEEDPITKAPSSHKIEKAKFTEIDLDDHSFLFKLAAK